MEEKRKDNNKLNIDVKILILVLRVINQKNFQTSGKTQEIKENFNQPKI